MIHREARVRGGVALGKPAQAWFLLFRVTEMKPLERELVPIEEPVDEVAGLQRALDKSYTRIRERAQAAWERLNAGKDPSDACVSVRVTPATESADSTSSRKSSPRSLVSKPRRAGGKTPGRNADPRPRNKR